MAGYDWQLWHRWDLVVLSVAVHVVVLALFLAGSSLPRLKLVNRPNGMLAAFFVALYAEMYGLPFTLYLAQPLLPGRLALISYPPPLPLRFLGSAFIMVGFFLVFFGWKRIHRAKGRMVSDGLYAHVRHPQYTGLALLALGQLVQWPTLSGLVLWPLVVLLYRRLSRMEDADLLAAHGADAAGYLQEVPPFVPSWRRWRRPLNPGLGTVGQRKESTRS